MVSQIQRNKKIWKICLKVCMQDYDKHAFEFEDVCIICKHPKRWSSHWSAMNIRKYVGR
jgi:hypothetical protein